MRGWEKIGKYAIRSMCGQWQIAKYGSSPTYALFNIKNGSARLVCFSDKLEELKEKAK